MLNDPSHEFLKPGVPAIRDYEALLDSALFRTMEAYSDDFLARHAHALAGYRRKWVVDPLHQWSRQWEYPFVYQRIADVRRRQAGLLRVLDAGAGVTFFSHYLASAITNCEVTCVDQDSSLAKIYDSVRAAGAPKVNFRGDDLREIALPSASFDIVYCISVLEHTDNYEMIVKEFKRIMKPGGLLLVTFDIAVNGDADIPPDEAETLLETLKRHFAAAGVERCESLTRTVKQPGLLTTAYARATDKRLLPWRHPFLSALKSLALFKLPKRADLTVYCCAFNA